VKKVSVGPVDVLVIYTRRDRTPDQGGREFGELRLVGHCAGAPALPLPRYAVRKSDECNTSAVRALGRRFDAVRRALPPLKLRGLRILSAEQISRFLDVNVPFPNLRLQRVLRP